MTESKRVSTSNPPQRVIVFASQLLPWSQTFIREQVLAMRRWHPILVGERLEPDGLSLDGIDFKLLCPREAGRIRRWVYKLFRLLRLPHPPSVRRLRALNASIIHAHFGTVAVDIWPLARALSLPMVVTLHGFDINIHREWWESGQGGWRRRRYPDQLLRLAREPSVKFLAVSKAIQTRATQYGIPANKITVQHIGIDTRKFHPGGHPLNRRIKRVLFVGRLVEKKGVEYLIRAFAEALPETNDAELVIIGDGPLRAELSLLASNLDIPATFVGVKTTKQVKLEIDQARILCVPSVTAGNGDAEGLPTVMMEAQASGVPVITSAAAGSTEGVIHGQTGLYFHERDIILMAKHISNLLSDDSALMSLSHQARKHAQDNFSLESCTSALETSYTQCCALERCQ